MLVWFGVFVCASATGGFLAGGQTMTGEPRRVPVNDTEVVTAARFAVAQFNRADTGERLAYKILDITSAKIQVVAGINYILDVVLGRTVCRRGNTTDAEPCALHSKPKQYTTMGQSTWDEGEYATKSPKQMSNQDGSYMGLLGSEAESW